MLVCIEKNGRQTRKIYNDDIMAYNWMGKPTNVGSTFGWLFSISYFVDNCLYNYAVY
jgi:hypothetical protein